MSKLSFSPVSLLQQDKALLRCFLLCGYYQQEVILLHRLYILIFIILLNFCIILPQFTDCR